MISGGNKTILRQTILKMFFKKLFNGFYYEFINVMNENDGYPKNNWRDWKTRSLTAKKLREDIEKSQYSKEEDHSHFLKRIEALKWIEEESLNEANKYEKK